jgi:hypothetical protein
VADGLTNSIGEALLSFVQVVWPDAAPQVRHFAETVGGAVRPNPPFTLQCPDGQTVTGLVILDHGRALLFVGTRQPAVTKPTYQVPERSYPERGVTDRGYPERTYDADQSLWSPRPYQR